MNYNIYFQKGKLYKFPKNFHIYRENIECNVGKPRNPDKAHAHHHAKRPPTENHSNQIRENLPNFFLLIFMKRNLQNIFQPQLQPNSLLVCMENREEKIKHFPSVRIVRWKIQVNFDEIYLFTRDF